MNTVNNVCAVIFQSERGQRTLLSCLLNIVDESGDEIKELYLEFTRVLIQTNMRMLSEDAKSMLKEMEPDLMQET